MYEIWLMLNIVWEMLLSTGVWLWVAVVAWLALMVTSLRSSSVCWGKGLLKAVGLGALVAGVCFLTLPGMVASSLSELRYWVDWVALPGMAGGIGAAVAVFTWPVWTRLSSRST